jgi:hypothetical protein avisC_02035
MSANVKTADLAITIVVTLLKAAGLGPEADRILDAIEGAKSCIGLIDDIKNEIVSDPNNELIRSLFKTMEEEVRSIKADLKEQGLGKDEIESTADALIETTRLTVKQLAQDDDALLDAARLPDSFFKVLVHRAEPLPDWCDNTIGKLYEQLLKRVSAEFIERAKDFDRFDKVALASLLRDNLSAKKQRNRIERGVQENRAINLETNRVVKEDRATGLETNQIVKELVQRHPYSIPSRLIFGSRPDAVAEDRFVPRGEQEQLNALITDPTRRRTVLVGMRGCGKTQLAAALAQECEDANWSLSAWVNASSPESITSDLVELAKELKKELKIDTSDQPTPKTIIHRLFNRLKSADPSDRLIVFDNVENIDDLRGLLPSGKGLRIVATTTNNAGWEHHDWKTIKVGVFDRSESIDYLLTVTRCDDHDAADALAQRLGDLPLAIAQAAGTARHKDLSLARYLKRLDSRGEELDIHHNLGDEYTDDVATVLWMAVEAAVDSMKNGTKHMARRQLGALALLAESGVPTRWLDPTIEQQDDRELQGAHQADDEDAHDALTELIHRSIVQQSADKATTMLHRLQAQVLRESWTEKEHRQACESATNFLAAVNIETLPKNATDTLRRDTLDLIEQFRSISVQDYSHSLLDEEQVRRSLEDAFEFADDLLITYEALTLQGVVETLKDRLGSDHPDVLIAHDNLARAFGTAGRFEGAVRLYEQVIASRNRIQGGAHPDTLKSRNNLACIYMDADKITEAMAEHKSILAASIVALGIDDPQTLASRNNLARTYWQAGNLPKAKSIFKQVVVDSSRVLGPYDSLTLAARNNLAGVYGDLHEYTRAIELFEQVITDRSHINGDTHPETLKSRNNLACMYQKAGKAAKALAEQKLILTACIQALGEDNPQTIAARNNLASAFRLAGNLPKAESLFEQVEADSTHLLGADHPYTLTSRNNLAGIYRLKGEYTKAINLFKQVIADRSRVLGKNHPDTLTTRNNLAGAHRASGRVAQAVTLYSEILNDCLGELGLDHPLTEVVRENLEAARQELKQQQEESPTD